MNVEKEVKLGSARFNFQTPQWPTAARGLQNGEYRFLVDFDAHF